MFNTKPLARVNVARMVHSKFPKFGSRDVRNSLRPYSLPEKNAERVAVYFKAADKVVDALPGENIVEVAARSGVVINVGCCSNSCGICEVEVVKVSASGVQSDPVVVRSCVVGVPPGYARIEIDDITDAIWGVDGFDT